MAHLRSGRTGRALLAGALVLVMLAGCGSGGGKETPTPTATIPAPTATAPATPLPQITLGEVVFAADIDSATGGPSTPAATFGRSIQTIHAFVQTNGLPAGTTVRVEWAINGVAVPTLMQEFTLGTERPAGWIEVHLERTAAQPWPSGTLGVTITVDGSATANGQVQLSGF